MLQMYNTQYEHSFKQLQINSSILAGASSRQWFTGQIRTRNQTDVDQNTNLDHKCSRSS